MIERLLCITLALPRSCAQQPYRALGVDPRAVRPMMPLNSRISRRLSWSGRPMAGPRRFVLLKVASRNNSSVVVCSQCDL
jgi:hypothetical protein